MTHAKAASLTSALFAKKGAASPASLVIAELEEVAGEEVVLPGTSVRGRGKEASERKKASLPEVEQELPLLAFVDAQVAGDEAAEAAGDAAVAAESAEPGVRAEPDNEEIEPSPAASLLAGRSFALRVERDLQETGQETGDGGDREAKLRTTEPGEEAEGDGVEKAPALDTERPPEESEAAEAISPEADSAQAAPSVSGEDVTEEPDAAAAPEKERETEKEREPEKERKSDAIGATDDAEPRLASDPELETEPQSGTASATPESSDQASSGPMVQAAEPSAERGEIDLAKEPKAAAQDSVPVAPKAILSDLADLQAGARQPAVHDVASAETAGAKQQRWSPWAMAAVVLLGISLGFGGYVLWPRDAPPPVEQAASPDPASPGQPDAAATRESVAASAAQTMAPGGGKPLSTETQKGAAPELLETAAAPAPGSDQPAARDPSFDVIRIEPNGQSIIAGRADPFSEWILLNNGEPIGSVRADANGEWVILPDQTLIPGANAFSLVPKAERGRVAIPEGGGTSADAVEGETSDLDPLPPQSDAGGVGDTDDAVQLASGTPLPRMKPADAMPGFSGIDALRVVPAGGYEIQFASVRENAAAEQERRRLIAAYPDLLADLALQVKEASIQGAGVFYRLRSGPIDDLGQARELCRRLERQGQGCLVVMRSEAPVPVTVPELKPSSAQSPGLAPTQQAERPE